MLFSQLAVECQKIINSYQDYQVSVAIIDGEQSFLYKENQLFRAASTIKIPILLASYLNLNDRLDTVATIPEELIVEGAGVIPFITGKLPFTYRNLMELMIIVSDNTASNALLHSNSMHHVNHLMQKIGCKGSKIERYFMDESAVQNGFDNYTTAKDMILMLQQIGEPGGVLNDSQRSDALRILENQQFEDMLPAYTFDEEIRYYHKTGGLTGVDHDVAIINYRQKKLYVAVLTQGWNDGFTGKKCIAEIGKVIVDYLKE
ncbi:serine hydrolase [uncultured Rummeliibacillus sp.]|uniref:serine hydrolase n=1 Tax=uncultured Rummeliibacillus sp. TaxID=762292 RepID=UPI00262522A1|nr:serine hydrolase [uncultured Rummeliibacillus sp.]